MTPDLLARHLPFTWFMARDAGMSRRRLTTLMSEGEIRRVLYGVYQYSDVADNLHTRARAVGLIMPPAAVLVDRTASWLHGVDTFAYRELQQLPPLDVFVLSDRGRIRRPGIAGGERRLISADVMHLYGIRVTTPLRTALDLACRLSRRDALAALDGFVRVHGLARQSLEAQLPRFRGRRGVVQLRAVLRLADGRAESPGESWTRIVMLDAGLPDPELQVWVQHNGQNRYRLDLAYPEQRVCIEYDGRAFHDSPQQRSADQRRRDWLRSQGWTVIVVTKDDLDSLSTDAWLDQIWAALRSAAA